MKTAERMRGRRMFQNIVTALGSMLDSTPKRDKNARTTSPGERGSYPIQNESSVAPMSTASMASSTRA